jgi:fructose-1,6-bisphosphatase/inositol monophosphatase family enzyme
MAKTLPFTKGLAGYSVSIALISKFGEPFLGVVYDPVNKNLYHAVHGQGAFRNLIPWNLKQTHKNELTFYYNRSFNKLEVFEDVLLKLKSMALDMQLEGLKIGQLGGAAMNACWLLENAPACFFCFTKKKPKVVAACGIMLPLHVYIKKLVPKQRTFMVSPWI